MSTAVGEGMTPLMGQATMTTAMRWLTAGKVE